MRAKRLLPLLLLLVLGCGGADGSPVTPAPGFVPFAIAGEYRLVSYQVRYRGADWEWYSGGYGDDGVVSGRMTIRDNTICQTLSLRSLHGTVSEPWEGVGSDVEFIAAHTGWVDYAFTNLREGWTVSGTGSFGVSADGDFMTNVDQVPGPENTDYTMSFYFFWRKDSGI